MSLRDAVLFKDNHWELLERAGGDLAGTLRDVEDDVPVTVEVETQEQLEASIRAGVTHILVDNQSPDRVAAIVNRVGPGVTVEASGGITPERAIEYAHAGAALISIGALTHSVRAPAITFELSVE